MQKAIAVILLTLLTWFGCEIIREILRIYGRADSDIKLGVLTAAGSALAFIVNNAIQSSRERKARLFENKREVYDSFFSFFFSVLHNGRRENPLTEQQISDEFGVFTRGLMTWGSAQTINAVNEWQKNSQKFSGSTELKDLFSTTEKLLRALRKDLGHSDVALGELALSKLLLKNDDHDKLN